MNCEICGKSLTADNAAAYDICIDCWHALPMPTITRRAVREGLRVLLGGVALAAVGYVLFCGLFLL